MSTNGNTPSTSSELIPEITTLTLAVGESMRIPIKGFTEAETSTFYWSSSEAERLEVTENGQLIAVAPGQVTVTVKRSKDEKTAAKIKVYVISDTLYYSDSASKQLPIAINNQIRDILRTNFNITDNASFISKYKEDGGREELLYALGVDSEAITQMFRETLLSEVPGMTIAFGFYAAYAGIRNVYDLARASVSRMLAVFDVLAETACIPFGLELEEPSEAETAQIIANAGRIIGTGNENYQITDDAPEPTYLLDANFNLRTDSDVIGESLAFITNIEKNLPLPRTFSGVVKMHEQALTGEMVDTPQPGYLVQISGISSPAQDKIENEEDLSAYTDGDGRFSIVMPDRYNLQEAIKITICDKSDSLTGIARTRTVADSVPRMVFVRRASEILENEYIKIKRTRWITDEYGNKKESEEEISYSVVQIQNLYLNAWNKYRENLLLERNIRLKMSAGTTSAVNTEEVLKYRKKLKEKYEFILSQLQAYLEQQEKTVSRQEDELYELKIRIYVNGLEELYSRYSTEDLLDDETAQAKAAHIGEVIGRIQYGDFSAMDDLYDISEYEDTLEKIKDKYQDSIEGVRDAIKEGNQAIPKIRADIVELSRVIDAIERDITGRKRDAVKSPDLPDMYGISLAEISDTILCSSDEAAERVRQELMKLMADKEEISSRLKVIEVTDTFKAYLLEHAEDTDVVKYQQNLKSIEEILNQFPDVLIGEDYKKENILHNIERLLTRNLDADLGEFILIREMFDSSSIKPRALPSVRLTGEDDTAIYLPTDTAPSKIFNYSMVQRLIDPTFSTDGRREGQRKKLEGVLDVTEFKEQFYTNPDSVPVAISLGMGYILDMHQAWVPDGFVLGNLLYSLALAPGEEQKVIVKEHTENYRISDYGTADDSVSESYANNQLDNESAAFSQAADRYSSSHSDSQYYSEASSRGSAGLKVIFGLGAGSSSTSTNRGNGSSNASQADRYGEVSQAAQNFQSEIKTESARVAAAQRTSIRSASSADSESVASQIISNHNHSHVMTVQYWEVMRRYRMETCIENVELVLFVPMKPVRFLPELTYEESKAILRAVKSDETDDRITGDLKEIYGNYELKLEDCYTLVKESFAYRYGQILRHADVLESALPRRYREGLSLVKQFSGYPEWRMEKQRSGEQKIELELRGFFLECDDLVATLHFVNSDITIPGSVVSRDCLRVSPSLNTRDDVYYGLKRLREGQSVSKKQTNAVNFNMRYALDFWLGGSMQFIERYSITEEGEEKIEQSDAPKWKFEFVIPAYICADDVDFISVENQLSGMECMLSKSKLYMEGYEVKAVERYEQKLSDLYSDEESVTYDESEITRLWDALPECYTSPIASFTVSELRSLGALALGTEVTIHDEKGDRPIASGAIRVHNSAGEIDISDHVPILHLSQVLSIEEMFHHVLSNTLSYSQDVWSSLSDDERIMMLEQYTVDMNYALWYDGITNEESRIPLLNCVNAKRVIGYYGNCMLLPFTYPKKLADMLGKTAADVQEELYRFHTTNFRVPSTVISIPTNGMVGEAVLGATNVSEKVDITRFWNWKDSDIDHIDINQSPIGVSSLLDTAQTMTVNAPTMGAEATAHIDSSQLLKALVALKQPEWEDALENTDIRELIQNADKNASSGRESIVSANSAVMTSAIDAATKVGSAALTGGVSSLAGSLGDSDILKSALGAIGVSDSGISDLVGKISSGKSSYSDIIQGIANAVKKSGQQSEGGADEGDSGGTSSSDETGGSTDPPS